MVNQSISPSYWPQACAELSAADPIMAELITRYEGELLCSHGNAFQSLLRAIVGQQISTKSADAVWGRLTEPLEHISPEQVAKLSLEALGTGKIGLSRQKIAYVQSLTQHFLSGEIDPLAFPEMSDDAIIKHLTKVKGIGRWTAEMFLIFHLMRPDVLPIDDLGLLNAIKRNYDAEHLILGKPWDISESWRPWRTVATWYLWRTVDPVLIAY